jgi:hypothetical protein
MIGLLLPLRRFRRVRPGCVHIATSGPSVRNTLEGSEVKQAFTQSGSVTQTFSESGTVDQTIEAAGSVRVEMEEC